MRVLSKLLVTGVLLSCTTLLSADTLYNKRTGGPALNNPLGRAKIENGVIHWTDCFGKNAKDYSTTEYRVVPGNNCIPQGDRPPGKLPQTASSLPLIGVLGIVFGAVGLGLRMFDKTLHRRGT